MGIDLILDSVSFKHENIHSQTSELIGGEKSLPIPVREIFPAIFLFSILNDCLSFYSNNN